MESKPACHGSQLLLSEWRNCGNEVKSATRFQKSAERGAGIISCQKQPQPWRSSHDRFSLRMTAVVLIGTDVKGVLVGRLGIRADVCQDVYRAHVQRAIRSDPVEASKHGLRVRYGNQTDTAESVTLFKIDGDLMRLIC